jgi:hypothetical protein
VSIITFPTRCTQPSLTPSSMRFSFPSRDGVNSSSESRSGNNAIDLLRHRYYPASTCPTRVNNLSLIWILLPFKLKQQLLLLTRAVSRKRLRTWAYLVARCARTRSARSRSRLERMCWSVAALNEFGLELPMYSQETAGRVQSRNCGTAMQPSELQLSFLDLELIAEVLERHFQSLLQVYLGLPTQQPRGFGDIGTALLGIILWQRLEH